jgi:hypothetical protein
LIADAGVAGISLRAGTPPIDDGFIRKGKEKDTKGKGRRERRRKRDENSPKKEKKEKEEVDDSLPEELKPNKKVGAQGGRTGGMGMGMGGRMGGSNQVARKKDKRQAPSEEVNPEPTRQALKPAGRGYHFVAVRGIFPLHDQVNELARAMGLPSTQKEIQGMVQFRDFILERQTKVDQPGADPWSGPWEAVDRDSVMQLLENDVDGYAPETVLDGLLDGHICMPYPDRVVGQWDRLATHPDIKEFTLSEDEVERQVEYEWKLLEKVKKEEMQSKKPADKESGGFMKVTQDMRALNKRAQATQGDEKSVREKILDELKTNTGDKDQMNEQLEEFVRNRASAVDHFVLFRYLDIKVEPGKTYRYRVTLKVTNPFREKRVEEVTDPSIIEGEERPTEVSQPTEPVTVQDNAQFYVRRVDWRPGRPSLPSAEMDIFQWFAETGTVVNKALSIQLGQILGGRKNGVEVLRPVDNVFDSESVLFSTKDALVDISPGFSFDPSLHKDIFDDLKNVPGVKRAGIYAPEQVLVVDDNGELRLVDGMDQKADYDKTKTHYDQQNKAFETLRKAAGSDDEVFGGRKHHSSKKGRNDPRRSKFGRGGAGEGKSGGG